MVSEAERQLQRGLSALRLEVHPDIMRDFSALVAARVNELHAENKLLREMLRLILPLAKSYAYAHPVGSNDAYVRDAEALLEDAP